MGEAGSGVTVAVKLMMGTRFICRWLKRLCLIRSPVYRFWRPVMNSPAVHLNARATPAASNSSTARAHGVPWCQEYDLSMYDTTAMLESMCVLHEMGANELKVSMATTLQEMPGHVVSFGSSTPVTSSIKGQLKLREQLTSSNEAISEKELVLDNVREPLAVTKLSEGDFERRRLERDYAVFIQLDCSKNHLFGLASTRGFTLVFGGYGVTTHYASHLTRQREFCDRFFKKQDMLCRMWRDSKQQAGRVCGGMQVYGIAYGEDNHPVEAKYMKAYLIVSIDGGFCCWSPNPGI